MRPAQDIAAIWVGLLPRFAGSSATLQGRIKEMMVHSILAGLIPAAAAIPPSRSLAAALGVSRNTVTLALQMLVDKGFLVARERSGLFVNPDIVLGQASQVHGTSVDVDPLSWASRLMSNVAGQCNIVKPVPLAGLCIYFCVWAVRCQPHAVGRLAGLLPAIVVDTSGQNVVAGSCGPRSRRTGKSDPTSLAARAWHRGSEG